MLQSVTNEQAVRSTKLIDVLNYIKSANPIQKRAIEITLLNSGSFLIQKKPSLAKRIQAELKYAWFELSYVLGRGIFNKLFYVRSFRVVSLPYKLRAELVTYCNNANYNVMDLQFVRRELNYFSMLHKGEKTYLGYFIADNILD